MQRLDEEFYQSHLEAAQLSDLFLLLVSEVWIHFKGTSLIFQLLLFNSVQMRQDVQLGIDRQLALFLVVFFLLVVNEAIETGEKLLFEIAEAYPKLG